MFLNCDAGLCARIAICVSIIIRRVNPAIPDDQLRLYLEHNPARGFTTKQANPRQRIACILKLIADDIASCLIKSL
jgi:hypothetical protein